MSISIDFLLFFKWCFNLNMNEIHYKVQRWTLYRKSSLRAKTNNLPKEMIFYYFRVEDDLPSSISGRPSRDSQCGGVLLLLCKYNYEIIGFITSRSRFRLFIHFNFTLCNCRPTPTLLQIHKWWVQSAMISLSSRFLACISPLNNAIS